MGIVSLDFGDIHLISPYDEPHWANHDEISEEEREYAYSLLKGNRDINRDYYEDNGIRYDLDDDEDYDEPRYDREEDEEY